jgi:hypothetical protein
MNSDREHWFQSQVNESASRLANSSPELLSPTGRILRQVAADWFEALRESPQAPTEASELRVVRAKSAPISRGQSQLPLLGTVPEQ